MALRVPFPDEQQIPGSPRTGSPPTMRGPASMGAAGIPEAIYGGQKDMVQGMLAQQAGVRQMAEGQAHLGQSIREYGSMQQLYGRQLAEAAQGQAEYGRQLERNAALTAASGREIGQGLGQLGAAFQQIAAEYKGKADQAEVLSATQDLQGWLSENVDQGALAKQGKDAIGITAPTIQSMDEFVKERAGKLNNNEQRWAFEVRVNQLRESAQHKLIGHQLRETEKYEQGVFSGALDEAINSGSKGYAIPAEERARHYGDNLQLGLNAIIEYGRVRGWDNVRIKEEMGKFQGAFWLAAISNAVDGDAKIPGNSALGMSLFESNKQFIPGEMQHKVWAKIHPALVRDEANALTAIASGFTVKRKDGTDTGVPDYVEANKFIQANASTGEVATRALGQTEHLMKQVERVQHDQMDGAYNRLIEKMDISVGRKEMPSLDESSGDYLFLVERGDLGQKFRTNLRSHLIKMREHVEQMRRMTPEQKKEINDAIEGELNANYFSLSPEQRILIRPNTDMVGYPEWARKKVTADQNKIRTDFQKRIKEETRTGELDSIEATRIATQIADDTGFHGLDQQSRERRGDFVRRIQNGITNYLTANPGKKSIPGEELRKLMEKEVWRGWDKGARTPNWPSFAKERWKVPEGRFVPGDEKMQEGNKALEIVRAYPLAKRPWTFIDIPEVKRKEIEDTIRSWGKIPTPDQVLRYWTTRHGPFMP